MNKNRRENLRSAAIRLSIIKEDIERLKNEEENYYDNIPENLQCSYRAEESEECIEELDELLDTLEEIIDTLSEF